MNHFLQSLENSCNTFSRCANEKREQLIEIDDEYKILDKEVKKQLNVPPNPHPVTASATRATTAKRPRTKTRQTRSRAATANFPKRTAQTTVIRPAPFPVKNYVLPAQPVIGAARYYNSAAKKMKAQEEEMERMESEKYPTTIPRPKTPDEDPGLKITSEPLFPSRPSTHNEIDMYFDHI